MDEPSRLSSPLSSMATEVCPRKLANTIEQSHQQLLCASNVREKEYVLMVEGSIWRGSESRSLGYEREVSASVIHQALKSIYARERVTQYARRGAFLLKSVAGLLFWCG